MKLKIVIPATLSVAAYLLSGCGQSPTGSSDTSKSTANTPQAAAPASSSTPEVPKTSPADSAASTATQSAAPVTSPPSNPTANPPPTVADTPKQAVPTTAASISSAITGPVSQFAGTAAAQTDKVAASIGNDLVAKAKSLTQSAGGNSTLPTQVGSALQSLSAGKDANALTTLFQQAKQSSLTPQQTQLVKDVGNLASAYVVQKNFSSLDGAQGDVATIVNSLRKGSVMPAVPALQSLAQNASLTTQQKDLLGTLADQYAPGLKKATDSLKQGLQGLGGLGK